jgi:hypothetical protein
VLGGKGYVDNRLKRAARQAGLFWGMALKATAKHNLTATNQPTLQPQDVLGLEPSGASLSDAQAPVRIHQGASQGGSEERGPGLYPDWAHPSVSGPARLVGLGGGGARAAPQKATTASENPGKQQKNGTLVVASWKIWLQQDKSPRLLRLFQRFFNSRSHSRRSKLEGERF